MVTTVSARLVVERRRSRIIIAHTRRPYLDHFAVMGIRLPNRPDIKPPSTRTNPRKPMSLVIPRAMGQPLYETLDGISRGVRGYDCFSFMSFIMSWSRLLTVGARAVFDTQRADLSSIVDFRPYLITYMGTLMHGLIALPGGLSLSVFGVDSPLIIARTSELVEVYGDEIYYVMDRRTL